MNLKRLEEIAKEKGKILLIEKKIFHIAKENIEIYSESKLVESNGEQVKCRGIIRNIPVTKFTENDNGRVYGRSLWENVERKRIFEGSDCLTNHPDDEGDVRDTCGVWANFRINEETGNADLCCVGDNGALMLEILAVKGKIGFSTVGYGEFLEDGKTVNPETYDYERTDWVRDPSQGTYATSENLITEEKEVIKEENEKKEVLLKIDVTNNKEIIKENKETNIDEVKRMEKFQELNFKNNIKASIREAKKCSNPIEGIEILNELKVGDDKELFDKIEEARFNLQNKIDSEKKKFEEDLTDKNEKLNELQAKYDKSTEALETLKEKYTKAKAIIEKVGIAEDQEDVDNILKEKETMTESVSVMTENVKVMESDINQLVEDRKVMRGDIKRLVGDRKVMRSDIKKFIEKYQTLSKKYQALNKKYKKLIKEQEDMSDEEESEEVEPYVFESDVSEVDDVAENDIEIEDESVTPNEPSVNADYEDEEIIEEEDEVMYDDSEDEIIDYDDSEDEIIDYDDSEDEEIIEEEDEVIDDEEMSYEDEEIIEEDEEEFDFVDDVVNADEDEEDQSIVEKRKISKSHVIKEEIKKLYNQESKDFPAVKNIKKIIFKSNSVLDAVNKINKFKESKKTKNKKPLKITEKTSNTRPNWFPEGRY